MLLPDKTGKSLTTTKRSLHHGRHFESISKGHAKEMGDIVQEGKMLGWSQEQYKGALEGFLKGLREELKKGETILNNAQFTKTVKNKLIAAWERNTGQRWPRYPEKLPNGSPHPLAGQKHQAHHIIPQQNGGPHAWWNMHPLESGAQHQGGVHGKRSILNKIIKDANQ